MPTIINSTTTTTTTTTTTPNDTSNWNWKVGVTAGYIIIMTIAAIYFFAMTYRRIENGDKYVSSYWKVPDSIKFGLTPTWFVLDIKTDSLKTLKSINEDDKKILSSLLKDTSQYYSSYITSINNLAFSSNIKLKSPYIFVLLMTAICGAIGVLLRTANNLIGVACWKNDFNFHVWWPWYFLRPLIGFLIAPFVFIIIDGKILPIKSYHSYSNILMIAISILAGFSAEDVFSSLRVLSKRIFASKD